MYSTKYVETTKLRLYDGASWTSFSPYQASSGGQFLFDFNEVYSNYLGDNAGLDGRLVWIRSLTAGGTSYRLLKNVDVTIIESAQNTSFESRTRGRDLSHACSGNVLYRGGGLPPGEQVG